MICIQDRNGSYKGIRDVKLEGAGCRYLDESVYLRVVCLLRV